MNSQEQAKRVLELLDLTLLDESADSDQIRALCQRADTAFGRAAAVCIPSKFVPLAKANLDSPAIRVATVANFPSGTQPPAVVARQIETSLEAGADEIDVVYPWTAHLQGQLQHCEAALTQWRVAAQNRTLKVILETGELGSANQIESAADIALQAGADFLKTSTGKTPVSATPQAVRAMLLCVEASKLPCGVKVSGGINTLEEAIAYLKLAEQIMGSAWVTPERFRFGASRLLDDLLRILKEAT